MVPRHPSCARIRLTEEKRIVSPGPGAYVAILLPKNYALFKELADADAAPRRPAIRRKIEQENIGPATRRAARWWA